MPRSWMRRQLLAGAIGALTSLPFRATASSRPESFAEIETRVGGRIGVFALDTNGGRELAYRADERFAMCSTFKWLLAAAVLARGNVDEHQSYGAADLLDYSPITRNHLGEGFMTVAELAEAAVTTSDNTAAKLLLDRIGGPTGFTHYARSLGDSVTRLDRSEPDLNSNYFGDARDTTTPRAMVGLMRLVLCGDALKAAARERLLGWMRACETGRSRLRAGLPTTWTIGDKTGSGQHGAVNDVAIAIPQARSPILIAAYMSDGKAVLRDLEVAQADVARLVARDFQTPA